MFANHIQQLLFVGDIHGQYQKVQQLTSRFNDNTFIVFVGDLIDNKASDKVDHIATLSLVKGLVDQGRAICLMGNHELNAIGWVTRNADGDFCRPHSDNNRKQHDTFLQQVGEGCETHHQWIEWFKSLPLFLDFGFVRCIHACWDNSALKSLSSYLNEDNSLNEGYWPNVFDRTHPLFDLTEYLLKGPEVRLPDGYSFKDKTGTERKHIRVTWWKADAKTYREIAQVPADVLHEIPALPVMVDPKNINTNAQYQDSVPVFIGHYTLTSKVNLLSDTVACVDFNGGKDSLPLIGFVFPINAENNDLSTGHFISHEGAMIQP